MRMLRGASTRFLAQVKQLEDRGDDTAMDKGIGIFHGLI
jgi:hypothetical protein